MQQFNLRQLTQLTNIPIRRLRHVLDSELIPGRGWYVAENEKWTPRIVDEDAAVLLICAAVLLGVGYKAERVGEFVAAAEGVKAKLKGRNPLNVSILDIASTTDKNALFAVGDHSHVRITAGDHDSGWVDVDTGKVEKRRVNHLATTTVDFSEIKTLLSQKK